MIHCCCPGVTSCNGSLVVTLSQNCPFTLNSTVTLQYGSTTVTLTAPNDSGKYQFTSTTSSGWYSGENGMITVTDPTALTMVVDVTLHCYEVDVTILLTRNYVLVSTEVCMCASATVWVTQSGNIVSDVITTPGDCSFVEVPITVNTDGTDYIYNATAPGCLPYSEATGEFFPYNNCQVTIILTPDGDHYCCDCPYPSCPQLEVSNNLGTIILNWDTSGSFQGYYGYITANVDAYPVLAGSGPFPYFINSYELTNCTGALTPGLEVTFLVEYACFVGSQVGELFFYYANCGVSGSSVRKAFQDAVPGYGGNYGYNGYTGAFSGEPVGTPVTITNCSPGMTATAPPPPDDIYFGTSTITEIGCGYFGGVEIMSLDTSTHDDPNPFPRIETDKVRVGFVTPCLVMGGAEHHTLSLVKSLDSSRFEIQGVAVIGDLVSDKMVSMFPCVVSNEPHAVEHLMNQCDIVVSWAFIDLTTIENRPKIIYVNHLPKVWTYQEAKSLAGVDHFVAVSDLAKRTIASNYQPRTSVLWNAVDDDRMKVTRDRQELRDEWGISQDHYVIGYIGRLEPEKEPGAMIRLAWNLPSHFKVVIVGEGSLMHSLKGSAPPNVIFAGSSLEVGNVMIAFDHLVLPSRYESFGLSLAEAWYMGLPVISTDVGIASLAPGLTRLVPIDAEGETLARAVLDDLEDIEGTVSRVDSALDFAWKYLSIERFGKEWSDLLLAIL